MLVLLLVCTEIVSAADPPLRCGAAIPLAFVGALDFAFPILPPGCMVKAAWRCCISFFHSLIAESSAFAPGTNPASGSVVLVAAPTSPAGRCRGKYEACGSVGLGVMPGMNWLKKATVLAESGEVSSGIELDLLSVLEPSPGRGVKFELAPVAGSAIGPAALGARVLFPLAFIVALWGLTCLSPDGVGPDIGSLMNNFHRSLTSDMLGILAESAEFPAVSGNVGFLCCSVWAT
jgi:hypothetical protein